MSFCKVLVEFALVNSSLYECIDIRIFPINFIAESKVRRRVPPQNARQVLFIYLFILVCCACILANFMRESLAH